MQAPDVASPPKASVKLVNHIVEITAAKIADVLSILNADPHEPNLGAVKLKRLKHSRMERCIIVAGFVGRAIVRLKNHGYDVTFHDTSFWPQFSRRIRDVGLGLLGRAAHEEFLDAVWEHPRGQLAVSNRTDQLELLGLMLNAYPQERLIVATKNWATARRLARALRDVTDRPVTTKYWEVWAEPQGVLVVPILQSAWAQSENFPVFIYWDYEAARAKQTIGKCWVYEDCLLYAFVPTDQRLDEEDRFALEAIFGPVIYRLDDSPANFTDVTVVQAGPSSYPPVTRRNPLDRKRVSLWTNDRRNQQVADIAVAYRQRDVRRLQQAGLLTDGDGAYFRRWKTSCPRVAVFVETVEHARELAKLLPDWPVLAATEGLPVDDSLSVPEVPDQAVVCYGLAHHADVVADVVILAQGTGQAWSDAVGPFPGLSGSSMVVVDYFDDFDAQAVKDHEQRLRDYQHRGWKVSNQPAKQNSQSLAY